MNGSHIYHSLIPSHLYTVIHNDSQSNKYERSLKVFPILVVLAYMADINLLFCCKRQDEESKGTIGFAGEGGQENLELINGGADGEKINSDAKMVQQFMANMNQNPGIDFDEIL